MAKLSGRRIRTKDWSMSAHGQHIPIGWTAEIGDLTDANHYAINWDPTPEGLDMGWCLWTEKEIRSYADLVEDSNG